MEHPSKSRELPILFSAPMVRAILEGRKVQTRRVVKPQPYIANTATDGMRFWNVSGAVGGRIMLEPDFFARCPYGQPGDRLWVKEAHSIGPGPEVQLVPGEVGGSLRWPHITYAADGAVEPRDTKWTGTFGRKRSSIHMYRWASRITLELTEVRVQRLQEISAEDAIAEGVDPAIGMRGEDDLMVCEVVFAHFPLDGEPRALMQAPIARFVLLWDSINGKKQPGVTNWNANPWVWALTFRQAAP